MWEILEVLRRVARGERPRALGLDMMSEIGEVHPRPDHVHMAISIPDKYAAVQMVGYIARGRARSTSPGSSRRGARASCASLLGAGLLHLDVGSRRGGDSAVHPASLGGGSPAGSVEIRLIGRPPPRQGSSGRAAAPSSRLDRLALAPPSAGRGSSRISVRFSVVLDQR